MGCFFVVCLFVCLFVVVLAMKNEINMGVPKSSQCYFFFLFLSFSLFRTGQNQNWKCKRLY